MRAFVTPVAIVSPAAAATQGAAPQGAAPPGGVFAALFAAITEGPAIDANAAPTEGASTDAVALLLSLTAATTPAEPKGVEPQIKQQDGDQPDDEVLTTVVPPPAALVAETSFVAANGLLVAAAPVQPLPATEPTPTGAAQTIAPNPQSGVVAPAPQLPAPLPAPLSASAAADVDAGAPTAGPPIETAAQVAAAPPPLRVPAGSNQAQDKTDTATALQDDAAADSDSPQLQPGQQVKKPAAAAGDTKPVAAETKPPPAQAAAGGSNATIFVATTPADTAMPLPVTDASAQVKTVPLSNLANLPNGAAVTAIGAVIAGEAAAGTNRFLIRLDPPELGRIDVRLRFGRDGEVHARLIADRPETASLLMRDAAMLERALNAAGMRTDSGVDVMLRDSSNGFAGSNGESAGDTPASSPYRPAAGTNSLPDAPPGWIRPTSAGRLDLTV